MKKFEVFLVVMCLLAIALLLCGCNETQKIQETPTLRNQLLSLDNTKAGRQWKEAFGDNIETAQSFNLFLLNDAYTKFNKRITDLEAKDPNDK